MQILIETCKRLYAKGWLAACDGNVSLKTNDETLLITPSKKHKGFLENQDLSTVTIEGKVVSGNPSSELQMHLAIYSECPHAKAVIHAHTPVATAWSIAFPHLKTLPSECCSSIIPTLGEIPIVPYARPGTAEMGTHLKTFLPDAKVMILARHGALCWGESLEEAFNGMERLEHSATTLMYAQQLGGLTSLPDEEVRYLKILRNMIGNQIL